MISNVLVEPHVAARFELGVFRYSFCTLLKGYGESMWIQLLERWFKLQNGSIVPVREKRQRSWAIPTSLTHFDVTLRRNLLELKSSAQSINETSVLRFHFAIYL
jgi:hypothetical protein